jgi:hypothetical protein
MEGGDQLHGVTSPCNDLPRLRTETKHSHQSGSLMDIGNSFTMQGHHLSDH